MDADIELATLTSLLDLDGFEVVEATRDRRNKLHDLPHQNLARSGPVSVLFSLESVRAQIAQ